MSEAHITVRLDDTAEQSSGAGRVRVTVTPVGGSWAQFYSEEEAGPFLDLGTGAVSVTIAPGRKIAASDVAAARALLIVVADYAAEVERLHLAREKETAWAANAPSADEAAA
jgi:hypothetical protein